MGVDEIIVISQDSNGVHNHFEGKVGELKAKITCVIYNRFLIDFLRGAIYIYRRENSTSWSSVKCTKKKSDLLDFC